jgi:hypothetical protein
MLTCLTHEDALRLMRKTTQKEFLLQLVTVLRNSPSKLDVVSENGGWSSISSLNHQLARHLNSSGEFSHWATWSDLQSMYPLFMASWSWWEPLLQGAVSALQLAPDLPRSLAIVDADVSRIWTVLAAIAAMGVDEVYLLGQDDAWQPMLNQLPVTVQHVQSIEETPCDWVLTDHSVSGKQRVIESATVEPTAWYQLFQLLCRLSNELCVGHRVDFSQQQPCIDQALDRLLSY